MNTDQIGDLLQETLTLIFMMSAPVLFTGLAVGFLISIFQAATQINEVTLVFIPKMFATGLVLWLAGSWIFQELTNFFAHIEQILPTLAHGGGL
ncbi:MAG: flagellar biosynthesis protein FliQ [Deltaproteobacteria bacterium]|jgi:flagellar biosynthetic protein FliQ|nr:flagellar biosynthesis protein FliQ [Deltaproteobacteria bacterium]